MIHQIKKAILLLLVLITGCRKEVFVRPTPSSLTLIVYLGGDNNLTREVAQKMSAIELFARSDEGVKSGKVNILIYCDVLNQPAQLYKCSYGASQATAMTTYGEQNSASPTVLSRVLSDCRQAAPADSYGLVLFSHASGWLPEGSLGEPNRYDTRSVITDGASEMEIRDFAAAIPDEMFEFIVFEACFMASVEVASELRSKTKYIMASAAEMLSPGFTDVYPEILSHLTSESDPQTALTGAARVYFDHFNNKVGEERSATISVIRTSALDELAARVRVLRPYDTNVDIARIQHFDRNNNRYHLFFDLRDYLFAATSVSPDESIENVVVYRRATPTFLPTHDGFAINTHCGLTTYIPQERFPFLNNEYAKLNWHTLCAH